MRFVSQNSAALSSVFRVTTPPWETVQWAYDKRLTYQRAQSLGIGIPRTYSVDDLQGLRELDLRFPIVLKPTVHDSRNVFTSAKAWRADDRAELLALYARAAALVGGQKIVVQELIPGSGATQFSYAAPCDRGIPVGSLVARRERQYPIDFGFTSTYVQSVAEPAVEAAACRFLGSLDYSGLVEIEFKFDAREQRYKILDVNARSWTWTALGSMAGVDFPYLQWRLAVGKMVSPIRGRAGVGWMHFPQDAVAACQEMFRGTLTASRYLESFANPLVFATFATDDPLAGMVEMPLVLWRVLARQFRAKWQAFVAVHP